MTYTFLEGITQADVAFEARGKNEEELIVQAGLALESVQVELSTVRPSINRTLTITASTLDNLLFKFLEELVFLKDTEQLVFCAITPSIRRDANTLILTVTLGGELINQTTQRLGTDIKAVTLHHYLVEKTSTGWKAIVVIDI